MGREGKRRKEGRERKGRDEGGKGKVTEGMGGTVQDMRWEVGKERERRKGRKGRRGAIVPQTSTPGASTVTVGYRLDTSCGHAGTLSKILLFTNGTTQLKKAG